MFTLRWDTTQHGSALLFLLFNCWLVSVFSYGASRLSLSKIVNLIVKLLEDQSGPVSIAPPSIFALLPSASSLSGAKFGKKRKFSRNWTLQVGLPPDHLGSGWRGGGLASTVPSRTVRCSSAVILSAETFIFLRKNHFDKCVGVKVEQTSLTYSFGWIVVTSTQKQIKQPV